MTDIIRCNTCKGYLPTGFTSRQAKYTSLYASYGSSSKRSRDAFRDRDLHRSNGGDYSSLGRSYTSKRFNGSSDYFSRDNGSKHGSTERQSRSLSRDRGNDYLTAKRYDRRSRSLSRNPSGSRSSSVERSHLQDAYRNGHAEPGRRARSGSVDFSRGMDYLSVGRYNRDYGNRTRSPSPARSIAGNSGAFQDSTSCEPSYYDPDYNTSVKAWERQRSNRRETIEEILRRYLPDYGHNSSTKHTGYSHHSPSKVSVPTIIAPSSSRSNRYRTKFSGLGAESDTTSISRESSVEDLRLLGPVISRRRLTQVPTFSLPLRRKIVAEGDTARLSCTVQAIPDATVTWFKDGQEIVDGGRYKIKNQFGLCSLQIDDSVASDTGKYVCKAINSEGEQSTGCELLVENAVEPDETYNYVRPSFPNPPRTQTVTEGHSAYFDVTVSGTPKPTTVWFKDDVEIEESDHIKVEKRDGSRQTLVITKVTQEDAGMYKLNASSAAGKVSCVAELIVTEVEADVESEGEDDDSTHGKQKRRSKQSLLDTEHKTAKRTSRYSSYEEDEESSFSYKSREKKSSFSRRKDVKEEIHSARKSESFSRTSASKHELRSVEKSKQEIKTAEEEEIDIDLEDPEVSKAATKIQATFRGHRARQDVKEKKEESIKTDLPKSEESTPAEEEIDIDLDDPEVAKAATKIQATFRGHSVRKDAQKKVETKVVEEDLKKDSAKPTEAAVPVEITKPVETPKETKPEETKKLAEAELTTEDKEAEKIKASIDLDDTKGAGEPVFTKTLTDTSVKDGDKLVLEVELKGAQPMDVGWLRNNQDVENCEDFRYVQNGDIYQLVIAEVFPDDAGTYVCEALNDFGEAETSATVTVIEPKDDKPVASKPGKDEDLFEPEFITKPKSLTVEEGQSATFTTEVDGEPVPTVQWSKDGQEIQDSGRIKLKSTQFVHTFEIPVALSPDSGTYTCTSSNSQGKTQCEFTLTVKQEEVDTAKVTELLKASKLDPDAMTADVDGIGQLDFRHLLKESEKGKELRVEAVVPNFTKKPKNQKVPEGSKAVFTCEVTGTPEPEITWYVDNKLIKQSKYFNMTMENNVCTLTIAEAFPEDAGEYKCNATNIAGEATVTAYLEVDAGDHTGSYMSLDETEDDLDTGDQLLEKTATNIQAAFSNPEKRQEAVDIDLDDPEVAEAAKKIQAAFRVHKSQKGSQDRPPKFTKELQDIDVCVGSALRLDCQVDSSLELETKWFKDDAEISEDGHYSFEFGDDNFMSLIITEVEEEDDGTYTVEVINAAGSATSTADVFVDDFTDTQPHSTSAPPSDIGKLASKISLPVPIPGSPEKKPEKQAPEFILRLRNKTVAIDSVTKLCVTVKADPPATIRWFKEGEELETGEKYEIFEENEVYNLEIYDTDVFDSGTYSCTVTNSVGSATCNCNVTIEGGEPDKSATYVKPTVTQKLKDLDVLEGSAARFDCRITGEPDPEIKWYKDGKPLSDGATYKILFEDDDLCSLVIPETLPSDSGLYSITAENPAGSVSSKATLFVESLSDVEEDMEDSTGQSGGSKDKSGKSGKKPGSREDKKSAPEFLKKTDKQHTVQDGETLTLKCEVTGNPKPTVTWYYNDREIQDSEDFHYTTEEDTHCLVIKEIFPEDAGQYTCKASNSEGSRTCGFSVHVKPVAKKPECSQLLREQQCIVGDSVTLNCEVTGIPAPQVSWLFEGKVLQVSDNIQISQPADGVHALTVMNVTGKDQGEYACKAVNSSGQSTAAATVLVDLKEVAAKIESSPKETRLAAGETLTIQCDISGTPDPRVTWKQDGEVIEPNERIHINTTSNSTVLTVQNVQRSDSGAYQVMVSNKAGSDTCSVMVVICDKPDPPSTPSVTGTTKAGTELCWTAPSNDGGIPITSYLLEFTQHGKDQWNQLASIKDTSYTVKELSTEDECEFRVSAVNSFGKSDPSVLSVPIKICPHLGMSPN